MALDLDWLKELAISYGFLASSAGDQLDVVLPDGLTLIFSNADDDETIGLSGGEWHFHPPWVLEVGDGLFRQFDAEDVLPAVAALDLIVVDFYKAGELADRWLEHRECPIDLKYAQPDEELRIRVAGSAANSTGQ